MSGSPIIQNGKLIGAVTQRFRTRLDKRLRNIHRKYVKTGEFTGNVWINVELLLQDSLDYAKWHRYNKRVAF